MSYVVARMATFGENLRALREKAGFKTSKALADALGAHPSVVSKMENDLQGMPEGPTLLRLAKALGCSLEDLVRGVDAEYDAVKRARMLRSLDAMLPKLQVLKAALAKVDPYPDDDDDQSRAQIARLSHLATEAQILSLFRMGVADGGLQDLSIIEDHVRRAEEEFIAAGLAGSNDDDDVEDDRLDVTGYRREEVPVIAEGDASPQPNLFWGDDDKLLSEVEDRITRPFDVKDRRAYGVRVRGDSMIDRIRPGEIVIVSPNETVQDGDDVYAQLLTGERLIKKARRLSASTWLLESVNRAYEPRMVKKSEIGSMHKIVYIRPSRSGERVVRDKERPT